MSVLMLMLMLVPMMKNEGEIERLASFGSTNAPGRWQLVNIDRDKEVYRTYKGERVIFWSPP